MDGAALFCLYLLAQVSAVPYCVYLGFANGRLFGPAILAGLWAVTIYFHVPDIARNRLSKGSFAVMAIWFGVLLPAAVSTSWYWSLFRPL